MPDTDSYPKTAMERAMKVQDVMLQTMVEEGSTVTVTNGRLMVTSTLRSPAMSVP
jgi:hypothetical protein